jgi:hypothetical protein
MPAPTCLRKPMICSSLNLFVLMSIILRIDGLLGKWLMLFMLAVQLLRTAGLALFGIGINWTPIGPAGHCRDFEG